MKKSVPISVWNLGSSTKRFKTKFADELLWKRMDRTIAYTAKKLPVFLVNPSQMDYLYPPKRRRAMDPKAIRKCLERSKDLEWLDCIEDLGWEKYREIVAVGLYLKLGAYDAQERQNVLERGDAKIKDPTTRNAFFNENGPAIFICPERVVRWAQRKQVPVDLVLAKIFYHELGHAVMDTGDDGKDPYDELWGRTVEESLANWIALKQFEGKEAILVHHLVNGQPAEYRGCLAVENCLWPTVERPYDLYRTLDDIFLELHRTWQFSDWTFFPFTSMNLGMANFCLWRAHKWRDAFQHQRILEGWQRFARILLEWAVTLP